MDIQQQLKDLRQLVTNSRIHFQDLHEKRSGPISEPTAVVIDSILPLQLVIPATFHAEIQEYKLSSHSREILSRTLDGMMGDYMKEFDDSCRKLSQNTTTQLLPLLLKVIDKLREGLQTHFESTGLHKIKLAVIEHAAKRLPCSTPQHPPPLARPKPFNKEYTPLLNEYFKFDAYPTTSDQKIIAERSGMTQGQIFNWFQNHRRIAHQNGTQLKKRPTGSYVPPNVQVPFLSTLSTSFTHPQQTHLGLCPNGKSSQVETEIQTAEEAEREKQRMLDIFNAKPSTSITSSSTSTPALASPAFAVSSVRKSKGRVGTGTGFTADDPIEIPSSNSDSMMITYTPGEAVGVVQHVDSVDRVARNARSNVGASVQMRPEQRDVVMGENEEGEEDVGEESVKFLSIITPRYLPSFASSSALALPAPPNPLDFLPSSSDSDNLELEDSVHLAPLVRPLPEPLFRTGKERGDTLPPLPSPSSLWFRLAPETSYMVPPPPSAMISSSAKSKSKKKEKEKEKTSEELAQAAASKEAEKVMMQRLMCWSLEDAIESGSGSVTLPSSSATLASRAKARAKKVLRALGLGSDAATCAITVEPSRAPFWAFIPSRGSSTPSSSSSGSMTGVVSTPTRIREKSSSAAASSATKTNVSGKKQKPAALGPKRKPRGSPAPAPSASTLSSSKLPQHKSKSVSRSPEPESSRSSTPSSSLSHQGQSLQRHGSSSSLSSTASSSSSVEPETDSRPRTPVDGVDIPRMPVLSFGFPLPGFTTVSSSSAFAAHPSSLSFASFEAYGVDVGMPVKQAVQPQAHTYTSVPRVPDYAFGNPYVNTTMSSMSGSGAVNPMHTMHSHSQPYPGMDMSMDMNANTMSVEELNALLGIGSAPTSTFAAAPASGHAPTQLQHGYIAPQPQMQQGHNPYNSLMSIPMGMGGYQGFNMTS